LKDAEERAVARVATSLCTSFCPRDERRFPEVRAVCLLHTTMFFIEPLDIASAVKDEEDKDCISDQRNDCKNGPEKVFPHWSRGLVGSVLRHTSALLYERKME
jgi:hypothetical protein